MLGMEFRALLGASWLSFKGFGLEYLILYSGMVSVHCSSTCLLFFPPQSLMFRNYISKMLTATPLQTRASWKNFSWSTTCAMWRPVSRRAGQKAGQRVSRKDAQFKQGSPGVRRWIMTSSGVTSSHSKPRAHHPMHPVLPSYCHWTIEQTFLISQVHLFSLSLYLAEYQQGFHEMLLLFLLLVEKEHEIYWLFQFFLQKTVSVLRHCTFPAVLKNTICVAALDPPHGKSGPSCPRKKVPSTNCKIG